MILASIIVDKNMLLSELITLIITSVSVIVTLSAVLVSLRNVKFLTKMRYKRKNLENKESSALDKNKADIIFTNNSEKDACIESIVCRIGDTVFDVHTVLLDNEPVKFPIVLKSLHSIKIKSVEEQALYYLLSRQCRFVPQKENLKLKFTLIDSQANESSIDSKYRVNEYSNLIFFEKDIPSESFDKIVSLSKELKAGCIFKGSTYEHFSLYCIKSEEDYNDILALLTKYIQKNMAVQSDEPSVWQITLCRGGVKVVYHFNKCRCYDMFLDDLGFLSTEVNALELERLDLETLKKKYGGS